MLVAGLCILCGVLSAQAEVNSGRYTGNGAASRAITGAGFQPEIVIIKGDNTESAVIRTATMPAGTSKQLAQDQPMIVNRILGFAADGFNIGNDADVNASGVEYAWVAFSSSPGDLKLGTYTGNGNILRNVTGSGFQPELVFVLGSNSKRPVWRSSAMPWLLAMDFDDFDLRTSLINSFLADGFQVAWNDEVNQSGVVYHYIAWNATPGAITLGQYTGNGHNDQRISSPGFKPEWVLVKDGGDLPAVQKPKELDGHRSGFATPEIFTEQGVRDLEANGFKVGNDPSVNASGRTYYYAAFEDRKVDNSDLEVTLSAAPTALAVGQDVVHTVGLRNNGPDDATGVAVTLHLPVGLSFLSASPGSGSYDSASGVWTLGSLGNNTSAQLTVTSHVEAAASGQVLHATAAISAANETDPNGTDNAAAVDVTVAWMDADLAVAITVGDDRPDEGEQFEYTFSIHNVGPGVTTGVRLQTSVAAGIQIIQAVPGGGTYLPATGVWELASLAAGDVATLIVTARAAPGTAGQTLSATVSISAAVQPDPVAANNAAGVDVVVASSDLSVALTASDTTPDVGQTVTIGLTLVNDGPDAATGIALAAALPTGLTYQSHAAEVGVYDSATGAWTVGPLAAAATASLQITAIIGAGTGGTTLTTTATVTAADRVDPNGANDTASIAVVVTSADLALSLSADDAAPDPGDTVVLTVTLANHGPDDADGITVATSLPFGLGYVSAAPGVGGYSQATGVWSVGDLIEGGTATLQITTTASGAPPGAILVPVATITAAGQSDPVAANNTASFAVVMTVADLALGLSADNTAPNQGDPVVFTITLVNHGPDDASGIAVTTSLPAELTYVGCVPASGVFVPGTGVWTVDDLSASNSTTLRITTSLDGAIGGTNLITGATITAADQGDPALANNSASAAVGVTSADLGLLLAVDDDTPDEHQPVTFSLTLTNHGPNAAGGVVAALSLPGGLTYAGDVADTGGYDHVSGAWTVGGLGVGATATLDVTFTVDGGTAGSELTVSGNISASEQGDAVPGNNAASQIVTVTDADLALSLTVTDSEPDVLQQITFTLGLSNHGPDTADGIAVAALLPAGLTYESDAADQGGYNHLAGLWTVGGLAAGASANLNLTCTVRDGAGGSTLTLSGAVSASNQGDTVTGNNTAARSVIVTSADLALSGSITDATPDEGQQVTRSFILENFGPSEASGVTVAAALPPGMTFVSGTANQGVYDHLTGVWTVGDLAAGAARTLDLTVSVDGGTGGSTLTSSASVATSGQSDPTPANNATSIAVTVTSVDLGLALSVSDSAPDENDTLDYTLKLTNHGPDPATGVGVAVALPAGIGYLGSVPAIGVFDSASGIWSVGNLAAAAATTLRISAVVSTGTAGSSLTVSAGVNAAGQSDPVPANNTATVAVTVGVPTADLSLAAAFDTAEATAGGTAVLRLRLANDGPYQGTGIGVDLTLPAHLTVFDLDPGHGEYDTNTGRWLIPTLAAGAADTLVATCSIASGATGYATAPGAVISAGDQVDPDPSDNIATANLTIAPPPSLRFAVRPFADSRRHLLPGGASDAVLCIDVVNSATAVASLNAIAVRNPAMSGVDQSRQDAAWAGLDLRYRTGGVDVPVPVVDGGNPAGNFVDGTAVFGGLDLALAPGDTLRLALFGAAALDAPDGLVLSPVIEDADALSVPGNFTISGTWPLIAAGVLAVDGMTAAQIMLRPIGAEVFQLDSVRNVALDVTLPGNGGMADHLTRFNVRNHGTATAGNVLTRLELWADDGDGSFDAAGDTRIAPLTWTGDRWEATGLWHPVSAGGLQIYVTVDVAADALGGTVQLGLPAGDDTGVGMASGNDGPNDDPVINPFTQTVSATDRIIAAALPLTSAVVAPGQSGVTMLHLIMRNLYDDARVLTRLQVRNTGRGQGDATQDERDRALSVLSLRRDGNGDGVLGSVTEDPVIGTAVFAAGRAQFTGLNCELQPGSLAHLFLTAGVSRFQAADGDTLGVVIGSGADLDFGGGVALVGAWPLDSQARHRVDGMVSAQIDCRELPPVSLTAGEGPVLAFDFSVPGNGYLADTLTQLHLVNQGSAAVTDIAAVQLWADDGDGLFTPSSDQSMGDLAGAGDTWVAVGLNVVVPPAGLRLFTSLTVSDAPADSATVRFALPVDGVTVSSNNDGPRDAIVESPTSLLISTAPLLSNLQIAPQRSTLGQTVVVTMAVTNVSGENVTGISPYDIAIGGDGEMTTLSGPEPAAFDLATGDSGTFTWTFRAEAVGDVYAGGRCAGTGAVGGQPRHSLATASGMHRILHPAVPLGVYPVANLPFSINRGQTGVMPMTLTLINSGGTGTADIRLTRLVMTLDDGAGAPVVPADLITGITVAEGINVYCNVQDPELTGQSVTLDLTPPVVVTSQEPVTIGLRLDIRPDTAVRRFRASLVTDDDITAIDHVSLAPIDPLLLTGAFPVSSGTGNLVMQATGLVVTREDTAPITAGRGQEQVELLNLSLHGSGDIEFPADVRIGSFTVSLVDTLGRRLRDAPERIRRLCVNGSMAVHAEVLLQAASDSVVTFQLMPPVTVPVGGTAAPLRIVGQVPADATLGSLRLRLESSTLFDARDGNVGEPVPVSYQPTEIEGPLVTIQAPATVLEVSGTPRFPARLTIGATDTPALTLHLAHTAMVGTAAVAVDTLRLTCLSETRQPLDPSGTCDRLRVYWHGSLCADVAPSASADGVIRVPLTGVRIAAGEAADFDLVCDLEAATSAAGFELVLQGAGVVAHDVNLYTIVALIPGSTGTWPCTTGYARLVAPADELLVDVADRMPPLLAGDDSATELVQLVLRNGAPSGSGSLYLSGLTLRASDADGGARAMGETCREIIVRVGDTLWAGVSDLAVTDSTVVLTGETPLSIPAGETVFATVLAKFREGAGGALRLGLTQADLQASRPDGAAGLVRIRPAPGATFPFWTAAGHFSGLDLASSYINYPNPFAAGREATSFAFNLPQAADVSLRILSARGESVFTLLDGLALVAGLHQNLLWDGRNGQDQAVHNGVYIAELIARYTDGRQERLLRKVAVVR